MSYSRNLNCPLPRNVVNIVQTVCHDEASSIRVLQRQEYLDPNRTKASCLPSETVQPLGCCLNSIIYPTEEPGSGVR